MKILSLKDVQIILNKDLNISLIVDGIIGKKSRDAIKRFQLKYNLQINGIPNRETLAKLQELNSQLTKNTLLNFGSDRFVVFVDAGHSGVDSSGNYLTTGKRAFHPDLELHDNGHYYEGLENRIVAESFIEQLTKEGIQSVRTYHPVNDSSLYDRANLVNSYLKRGYFGYLHSFHSNAISSSNSKEKLENTIGFMVFSTKGDTMSDLFAEYHFQTVVENVSDWKLRTDLKQDNDSDFEENFSILRNTDTAENIDRFGAFLEEWGFHTSSKDCAFIVNSRDVRVKCAVQTAKKIQKHFENLKK